MGTANIHWVFHLASVFLALSGTRTGPGRFRVDSAVGMGWQQAAASTVLSTVLESRRMMAVELGLAGEG